MKIRISASAFEDIERILQYYNEQGESEIGIQIARAIIEHIQILSNHPDMGRVVPEFEQLHIREILHKPFRVVYQRNTRTIEIIRIWRSERLLVLP